jgi:hypothetical protein
MLIRFIFSVTVLSLWLGITCQGLADPPSFLSFLKSTDKSAKPQETSLELAPEHGPWLILAASFEQEDAEKRAIELATELRKQYRLKAYVLPKKFDYTNSVTGSGFSETGGQKKMKYQDQRKVLGYGVLVGDFDSLDHPQSRETLRNVKTIQPKSLTGQADLSLKKWITKKPDPNAPAGPMAAAFLMKNPLLPEDYFQSPKVDKFVKSLNQNAEFSLLENKGRFTVRIATFRGADGLYLDRNNPEKQFGESGEGLTRAAEHAHLAAVTLRKAGYDAFEFHDRNSSSVTVGSFDSLGKTDGQGTFIYDLAIQDTVREFGGARDFKNSAMGLVPVAKTLLDVVSYRKIPELNTGTESEKLAKVKLYSIPFDIEPKPMAVPRPETNGLYSGSLLGSR